MNSIKDKWYEFFSTQIIWKYFFVPYSSYFDKGKWKILFLFHRPTDSYFSNDLPVEQHIKLVSPNVTFDWINIFMKFFHVKRISPVKTIVLAFFYKIFIFFFFIFIIYLKISLFQIVPLTNIFPKIQHLLGLKNSIKSHLSWIEQTLKDFFTESTQLIFI